MKTLPLWVKSKRKICLDDNENFKKNICATSTPRSFPTSLIFSGKFLIRRFIFASIVNFSINDVDSSKIVIFRMNSRFFKLFCVYFKCRRISLKLISWEPHSSLERERKILLRLFTSSIKREIWHFQVVVVQVPQRNVQNLKREARAKLLFCLINLLLFWRSRSRRRRRR